MYAYNKASSKYTALSKSQFTCHSNELVLGLCFVCLKCGLLAEEVFGLHSSYAVYSYPLLYAGTWICGWCCTVAQEMRQTTLAKEKQHPSFFSYQIVSFLHLSTRLHKLEHQCSKVVLQLSAAPTGNGRFNWPCECSLGRWLCWGLQCAAHTALGLVMDGLFQIFCFSVVCSVEGEDRLCSFSSHDWEQVIPQRK